MAEIMKNLTEYHDLTLLLEEAAHNGSKRQIRWPGYQFFGYFCSYWPEELLLAVGLEPLRILPPGTNSTPALLPTYCCSLARNSLHSAIKKDLDDLKGVGFAHTCDTMQCLESIWRTEYQQKVLSLVPPVHLKAPGAKDYYKEEMKSLLHYLSEITDKNPASVELDQALELTNHIRKLTKELDQLRAYLPSQLTADLLRAGQVMPREKYARVLGNALPILEELGEKQSTKPLILVSGAVLETNSLFEMIENLGGRVAADDTCTGYRHYAEPAEPQLLKDPLEFIIHRYMEMPPCPCRHLQLNERIDYLEGLADKRKVTGAVLVIRKFCEPHAWDSVPIAKRLKDKGIKTLVLELEGSAVGGQERTRLQAFLESLMGNS